MDKHKAYIVELVKKEADKHGFAFNEDNLELIHKGNIANAIVYRYHDDNVDYAIKSFQNCILPLRYTFGYLEAMHEYNAIDKLRDIEGMIPDVKRPDPLVLALSYIKGKTVSELKDAGLKIPVSSFLKFEELVRKMHSRYIVHLDLRNMRNIMVSEQNDLYMIDFQSSLNTKYFPGKVRQIMENSDLSGVYKAWDLVCEEPLPDDKKNFLEKFNKIRKLWVFKGYPLQKLAKKIKSYTVLDDRNTA